MSAHFRWLFALLVVACVFSGLALAAPAEVVVAPSAEVPQRPQAASSPDRPPLNQQIDRRNPTLSEERAAAIEAFRTAFSGKKAPRIMVLVNRDMEDNDDRSMQKVVKVTGAASASAESSREGNIKARSESVGEVYVPKGPAANDFSEDELESIQNVFEGPFIDSGSVLVDRDVAVSLSGVDVEAVFANPELPQAQQAQVASVKKHADILVTARVKKGSSVLRKVSGDYTVEVPVIIAKAISLSDGRVMASATTEEVKAGSTNEVATRVALLLMSRVK